MTIKSDKGVLITRNFWGCLRALDNEQKGMLVDAILEYAENAVVPDFDKESVLGMAWAFTKLYLDGRLKL